MRKNKSNKSTIDISTKINSLHLSNPTILASGILGLDGAILNRVAKGGAGAVTMKSLTSLPRKGHNNPILVEVNQGFLNAVGYANKGIDHGVVEFSKWNNQVPLIGCVVGADKDEFAILAEKICQTPISALEVVLSCPHTPGYGLLAGQGTPKSTAEITKKVKKVIGKIPLIIKLSPSIEAIADVARAAESEGADAINMGNSLGPGMVIDIERAAPVLAFKVGGMTGPAIKPIMIRCVFDLYKAIKIPIIATGGITYGRDAVEAMMAGATAVSLGTAIYYRGIDVFDKVTKEIKDFMKKNNYTNLKNIIGLAHQYG